MDDAVLLDIEAISRASTAADGAEPLDEGAWRRLRHHADELGIRVEPGAGFAVVDGELLHLVVAPEHRRRGVATTLAAAVLDASDHPWQAWSHGDHPAAAALAQRFGFERTRELWVMRRSMTDIGRPPTPDELRAHPPAEIRSYRAGDEAELLRVNAAAFAHHPEQGAMDSVELAERMAEPWFDPDGLLVAVDDHRMLGFHWTKLHSPTLGEVYVMAVDPAAQRFGLGRTLVIAGLDRMERAGVEDVLLYVESDNDRALRTYTNVGFTHAAADTHVMYTRGVSAPGS